MQDATNGKSRRKRARAIRRLAVLVGVLGAVLAGAVWAAPAQAATWCGTAATADRTQQLFGGPQIHVVYAIPADGPDRLGLLANAIQTDAENIDAWWRGQDPTRTPRFDLFTFACGPQLDLTTARLAQTGAQITSPNSAFDTIAGNLAPSGLLSGELDALVYYDGPVTAPNTCGIGGGGPAGGMAIVFVGTCGSAPTDWTAAHELAHSFGAVDNGAPHLCPDSGHTCDTATDLMFPFVSGNPLATAVLDPGRDDYYGHSGTWIDIQDSPFLKHLDAQVRLSVTLRGAGRVASSTNGVDCTAACATDWDSGASVSLRATPAAGMRLVRWTGDCSGASDCSLTLSASKSVTAFFAQAKFPVTASVLGKGTVRSTPGGIVCKPRCKAAFTSFKPLKLTAKPLKGWHLKAWTGACRGKKLACTVPMTAAASARAVFVKNAR